MRRLGLHAGAIALLLAELLITIAGGRDIDISAMQLGQGEGVRTTARLTPDAPSSPLLDVFPQAGEVLMVWVLQEPGSLTADFVQDAECLRSDMYGLRFTYIFTDTGNGSWGVQWAGASPVPFDASPFSAFTFWVKGTAPNGFQIRLRDTNMLTVKVEASEYVTVSADVWQQVVVPLSRFADGGVNLASLRNLDFGFNAQHGAGTICVDDMAFVYRNFVPLVRNFP